MVLEEREILAELRDSIVKYEGPLTSREIVKQASDVAEILELAQQAAEGRGHAFGGRWSKSDLRAHIFTMPCQRCSKLLFADVGFLHGSSTYLRGIVRLWEIPCKGGGG